MKVSREALLFRYGTCTTETLSCTELVSSTASAVSGNSPDAFCHGTMKEVSLFDTGIAQYRTSSILTQSLSRIHCPQSFRCALEGQQLWPVGISLRLEESPKASASQKTEMALWVLNWRNAPHQGGEWGSCLRPVQNTVTESREGFFPSRRGEAGVAERSSGRTKRRAGSGAAALPMGPAAAQAAPASLGDLLPR